jgi:hypothetical protein
MLALHQKPLGKAEVLAMFQATDRAREEREAQAALALETKPEEPQRHARRVWRVARTAPAVSDFGSFSLKAFFNVDGSRLSYAILTGSRGEVARIMPYGSGSAVYVKESGIVYASLDMAALAVASKRAVTSDERKEHRRALRLMASRISRG